MAKNIEFMGAVFPDVPSIRLPQYEGGLVSFDDTTDATATAEDIAQGKTAYVNGEKVFGTASGGGGGGGSVPSKDVNFIDYDGTVLHAYTTDEFLALSALPENPSHDGLTAQGWNWSLSDAQAQVQSSGKLTIGQMYITDDGKTRIYIHLEEGRTEPYLGFGLNGTVVIDWGDGSETTTVTGTSLTAAKQTQHVYQPGDYVISIDVASGSAAFVGVSTSSNGSKLLNKNTLDNSNEHKVYQYAVRKVEIGNGFSVGQYAFQYCGTLASVTIPNSVSSVGINAFQYCYSLVSVTIPNGVTSVGSNAFQYCYSLVSATIPKSVSSIGTYAFNICYTLASVTIPNSVTSVGINAFQSCTSLESVTIPNSVSSIVGSMVRGCYSLASVTIPNSVSSIGTYAFAACYGVKEFHFLPATPPTLSNANAFNSIPPDCVFYVPAESLEAYKTANNWSTYASRMVGE